jgi:hypothetical protein
MARVLSEFVQQVGTVFQGLVLVFINNDGFDSLLFGIAEANGDRHAFLSFP